MNTEISRRDLIAKNPTSLKVTLVLTFLLALLGIAGICAPAASHNTVIAEKAAVEEPLAILGSDEALESPPAEAIVIDHTCTDVDRIPDYWLEEAKKLAIHYAHTSHGQQITEGASALSEKNPKYGYSIFYAGSSPPASLPGQCGSVLCIYDGNPPETYITPEGYWSTDEGRNRTRAVADTGLFGFSMWSWCGQQSTNETSMVQLYLDTLASFEQEYPDMRYILMTGHTDGGSATLERNNDLVRQYALDHGMVLFDFADIESYDPAGNYYPSTDDSCPWCSEWCAAHPEDCTYLPVECAHSHPFNCLRKASAFWWMMARLAGWDGGTPAGSQKSASSVSAVSGETLLYTITVRDFGAPLAATIYLTDEVPVGLAYVPGTLSATAGTATDVDAPTLHWSGLLSPTPVVTITYAAIVDTSEPLAITNSAEIASPGYEPLTVTATILANPHRLHLPLVLSDG